MKLDQRVHLSYCTNIHSGETWKEVFESLNTILLAVKKQVIPEQPFGIGLRLSGLASYELLQQNNLEEFKHWLKLHNCYVFTINGFPYGKFHKEKVKDLVHSPDWTTVERLEYTVRLFRILSALTSEGEHAGISTSPLSYKPWYNGNKVLLDNACKKSVIQLVKLIKMLHAIEVDQKKTLHLDIEPEPDGFLENTQDIIDFFKGYLIPMGTNILCKELDISPQGAESLIRKHIRLCYDVCHFALAYEDPADVVSKLKSNGIQIGKVQISAALKTIIPLDREARLAIMESFLPFAESTYLHQVSAIDSSNAICRYRDLPEALEELCSTKAVEWRTHFHVPVFLEQYNNHFSTNSEIIKVLNELRNNPFTDHLEVETYTWEVLPDALKTDLTTSIVRELQWIQKHY